LYDGETWKLREVHQKYLEGFEMCYWKTLEKRGWTDRVKNEEVLHGVKEERNILDTIKKKIGQMDWSHLEQELPFETRY